MIQPTEKTTERTILNGQRDQRVLLTGVSGVSGVLGRVLCHQLRKSDTDVTGIDKNPPALADSTSNLTLALPQTFIQLDLTSQPLFDLLADQQFDTIFHLAGMGLCLPFRASSRPRLCAKSSRHL